MRHFQAKSKSKDDNSISWLKVVMSLLAGVDKGFKCRLGTRID